MNHQDASHSRIDDGPPEEVVVAYHERTKHHFHRQAASLGYLDWETQPDPFRCYSGAEFIRLPLPKLGHPLTYRQLFSPAQIPVQPPSIESISQFFRYALSLTAWKQYRGTTWSLRANPSSGNLHPTEGYALIPTLGGQDDGLSVYHYAPKEHALEHRSTIPATIWNKRDRTWPTNSFLVALSSIHWREAWKYGERAFRYCQHDVGHAWGALRIAAATLGWRLQLVDDLDSRGMATLLGLSIADDLWRAEPEEADLIAWVTPSDHPFSPRPLDDLVTAARTTTWTGKANRLSPDHGIDWPVIDDVTQATRRLESTTFVEDMTGLASVESLYPVPLPDNGITAEKVILGRRSAVSMDGSTGISQTTFFQILARLMPTHDRPSVPWDTIPWRPRIHLGLFVHRVAEIPTGLYVLVRDPRKITTLKQVLRPGFRWEGVPGCPSGLPLFLLQEGDVKTLATTLSCNQEIAGDGAFSLGMIAEYMDSLMTYGASFYRNLFWEAGMIGQMLYLEAEAAGIRGTGIGCYFDDPVHEAFGITSREWQSFYHFTVGGPVDDPRLITASAYAALGNTES
jgi:SagB-type dehydrogenase family enzyme